MLLVYLDESYKRGRDYWLAACAIHDGEIANMCRGIRTAAARIPAEFGVRPDVELHAQHLYHGDGDFRSLKKAVRIRVQVYRRVLQALADVEPGLFFVGVDWNDDLPTQHRLSSHRLRALRYLLPAIEVYCVAHDERCLVVADEEETTTEAVVAVVREHQSRCDSMGADSRVLDAPLFTPSRHSYGVQACDLVAFLRTRRAFARRDEDPRAKKVQDGWWDIIKPKVIQDETYPAPSTTDAVLAEQAA